MGNIHIEKEQPFLYIMNWNPITCTHTNALEVRRIQFLYNWTRSSYSKRELYTNDPQTADRPSSISVVFRAFLGRLEANSYNHVRKTELAIFFRRSMRPKVDVNKSICSCSQLSNLLQQKRAFRVNNQFFVTYVIIFTFCYRITYLYMQFRRPIFTSFHLHNICWFPLPMAQGISPFFINLSSILHKRSVRFIGRS